VHEKAILSVLQHRQNQLKIDSRRRSRSLTMSKRLWMILSIMLVGTLLVAACGGAAPAQTQPAPAATPTVAPAAEAPAETPAETPEAVEETPAPEPAAAEGPSLTIWADDTRSPVLARLAADCEAEYGIQIVVTERDFNNLRDDFKVAAPTGAGPDIIIGAHDWLGELVENGLLAEIDLGETSDLFLPAAVQAFVYDGTLYGMPYATENVAFVYNTEMIETAPTTWTEVREVAAQLEEEGVVDQGYIIQENDPFHFFPIQTAFGGYVFGLTEEGYDPTDVGIDSPGTIAAVQWLNTMYSEGHLQPGSAVNYDLMHAAFEGGNAAMMITGPWALPRIRESGIPYAVAPLPGETQPAQPFLGVQGFMVSAFSSDVLLAQTFLQEYVATEQAMQGIFDADPRPSAFLPVRAAIEDPDIAAFAEAGITGLAMPAIPEMSAVWSSWGNAMQLVAQQAAEPEEAFQDAAEQIRTAIAGN
jgi:arabinogalactan oligomer / maltooligosaccharide transport system substrate-binding protein